MWCDVMWCTHDWKASALYSSFPQATNQTLLDKFKRQHEGNSYIEFPAVMEPAFIIRHYAGKVKYGVKVSKPLPLRFSLESSVDFDCKFCFSFCQIRSSEKFLFLSTKYRTILVD